MTPDTTDARPRAAAGHYDSRPALDPGHVVGHDQAAGALGLSVRTARARRLGLGSRMAGGNPVVWIVLAAIAIPLVWLISVQIIGPDDGTLLNPTTALGSQSRWRDGPVIDRSYTPALHTGDIVERVDGIPLTGSHPSWPTRVAGERVTYLVLRNGKPLTVVVRLHRFSLFRRLWANVAIFVLPGMLFLVGSVVFVRRPRDRAAQLLLAVAAFNMVGTAAWPIGLRVIDLAGGRGVWPYVGSEIGNALMWSTFLHFTIVFPHPPDILCRRPRLIIGCYVLPFALYGLGVAAILPAMPEGAARVEQEIAVSAVAARIVPFLLILCLAMSYRRTRETEMRRRMRWVVASLVLALAIYVAVGQVPDLIVGHPLLDWVWVQDSFAICPLAIAAAILRYRLFDVELMAKRSLIYGGLTAGLIGIYAATLLALATFPSNGHLIVLGTVAAIALGFHPLKSRLRTWVSHLIYGSRDDPYEVVSQLGQLHAVTKPTVVLTRVVQTLAQTLQLSYVAIKLDLGSGLMETAAATGNRRGQEISLPLQHGGDKVGELVLDVKSGREPFGPADRRLLDDVSQQVGQLASAVLLNTALQRSRQRLVTAREEERRRLHRDLHDGIGPTLAAQAMQIDVAIALLRCDPDAAEVTLHQVASGTKNVIGEVRRVVDDLRPRALDQLGLVHAIQEKSASFHSPTPPVGGLKVDVDARGSFASLPAAVEVAAYRIATEAITNAARHGQANHCRVILERGTEELLVQIIDDGSGLPDKFVPGVGLRSMAERAGELGGTFHARALALGGTLIAAQLPLPNMEGMQ